jgi:hypothetical protein
MQIEINSALIFGLFGIVGAILFAAFRIGFAVKDVLSELKNIRDDVDLLIRHIFPGGRPPSRRSHSVDFERFDVTEENKRHAV